MLRSSGRRTRLIGLSCLLAFAGLTGGSLAARKRPTDAASLQRRLKSVTSRMSHVQRQLAITKAQQKQVNRRLAEIEAKLDNTETSLHQTRARVTVARADLRTAITDLRRANEAVEDRRDLVAERLVAMYEGGEVKPLEVALQSASFSDFANRMYLMDQVVSSDAAIIEDLGRAQDRADSRRQEVEARKLRYAALQQKQEGLRQTTLTQRAVTQEEKSKVLATKAALERALDELAADSASITVMLQRMQRRNRGGGFVVTPWRGSFIRPVSGRITSGFGSRFHPILRTRRMHTGVDMAASTGTPVHAAAGGVVIFSGRYGGYGNCVMIDHGGNVVTLYGHNSSLAVGVGQKVSQGQVVAYAGSTGLSTGPHCHFEVRKNGVPVNPLSF